MNWTQFKGLLSHMCLTGTVVAFWYLIQEVAGSISIFTGRNEVLRQGNVFTPVCHSVHSGWSATSPLDTHSPWVYTPWSDTPLA